MTSKRFFYLLAFALFLRLVFIFGVLNFHPSLYAFVDGDGYMEMGEQFHRGEYLFENKYFQRLPFYPAIVSFISLLPVDRILLVRFWNILVDAVALAMIYIYAKSAFNERCALFAGFLYALHPLVVYRLGMVNTEILQAALLAICVLGALFLLRAASPRKALLLSMAMTLFLFVNTAGRLLPVLYAAFMMIYVRGKKTLLVIACYLTPAISFILAWGVYNYVVSGEYFLFDTRGGKEFWVGNCQAIDGREEGPQREFFLQQLQRKLDRYIYEFKLTPKGLNDRLFQDGMDEIRANPRGALLLFAKKVIRFWFVPASETMLWFTIPLQGFYLLTALYGAYLLGIRSPESAIPFFTIAYFNAIYAVSYACIRYSHAVMPLVCIFSGAALSFLYERWKLSKARA
ncbi:MAG: glycosyltransferase family 39 protein [Candidatus Omnitrophota bacterium]